MGNQKFALELIRELTRTGVREFCVCPGARNSPLSALLLKLAEREPELRVFHHYEERSAAFFALGRIKATRCPVAVVTTSGTAAGELLPATMEAHYTALPLVLVTADRPQRFRGSGAPQTAEQPGIFGVYAEQSLDLAISASVDVPGNVRGCTATWSRRRPLHLNPCFDEPLLDHSAEAEVAAFILPEPDATPAPLEDMRTIGAQLAHFLTTASHPLAIVSALTPEDRPAVLEFLQATRMPVYLEATSGLRESPSLRAQRATVSDGLLARARAAGYPVDGVLRIGGVPTLRLWRDLEAGQIPVCSVTREPFSGLSWLRTEAAPIRAVLAQASGTTVGTRAAALPDVPNAGSFLREDARVQAALDELFRKYPRSEPALMRALSAHAGRAARVFVGNSLPIREWDLAADFTQGAQQVGASRGLNGIDGQVSTFLGYCDPDRDNWAVLGDLTTLYDLAGPWIASQLSPDLRATLVVMNNGGGKIFSRMFPYREFQNPHALGFSAWAAMWGLAYEKWETVPAARQTPPGLRVVELVPDAGETVRFWQEADPLWKK